MKLTQKLTTMAGILILCATLSVACKADEEPRPNYADWLFIYLLVGARLPNGQCPAVVPVLAAGTHNLSLGVGEQYFFRTSFSQFGPTGTYEFQVNETGAQDIKLKSRGCTTMSNPEDSIYQNDSGTPGATELVRGFFLSGDGDRRVEFFEMQAGGGAFSTVIPSNAM